MKYPARIYYTAADKSLMWDRWQKGESLNSIARHFGRSHSSIQGILVRTGGIRPPHRQRSGRALTLAEREEISRGVVAGQSLRSIAMSLGRAPSTIVGRLTATVAGNVIEPIKRTKPPGIGRTAQRPVNWPTTARWHASWRRS